MACRQMGGPRKNPDDDKQPWQAIAKERRYEQITAVSADNVRWGGSEADVAELTESCSAGRCAAAVMTARTCTKPNV